MFSILKRSELKLRGSKIMFMALLHNAPKGAPYKATKKQFLEGKIGLAFLLYRVTKCMSVGPFSV